jgi:hypothetical protein
MESLWRHILKSIFDEFVTGLDDNIDYSSSTVNLWDLNLKSEKIHEMYGDCLTSPVEFSDGKIGSVEMKMSWLGKIEISATNMVLNLNFTPFKAMKNAIMPGPELQEGFVHRVPEDLRRPEYWASALGKQPALPMARPRYCKAHFARTQRKKGEVRETQCARCKARLQTNYVECELCIPCSLRECQCVLCGTAVPKPADYQATPRASDGFVYTVAEMRHPDYMNSMMAGSQLPYQIAPRYCRFHNRPEHRRTGDVRNGQCIQCKARLQTNYEDLACCASCSDKECRCLLCGMYIPPQGTGGSPLRLSNTFKSEAQKVPKLSTLRSATAAQQGLGDTVRPMMSDPLPKRAHELSDDSSPDLPALPRSNSLEVHDGQQGDKADHSLKTPENSPRGKTNASDDEDVPMEDKLPTHRKTHHDGGASKEKAPKHSHWRHRWAHHHNDTQDELLVPPPPPEEKPKSTTTTAPEAQSHARTSTGPSHAAASMAHTMMGGVRAASGLFGFGHQSSSKDAVPDSPPGTPPRGSRSQGIQEDAAPKPESQPPTIETPRPDEQPTVETPTAAGTTSHIPQFGTDSPEEISTP